MIELKKINPTCSNVYLIDENACIADSFEYINSNVRTLSANITNLTKNNNDWNNFYTYVSQYSAKIISTTLNAQTIDETYLSPYTTMQELSSTWNKGFSLYYPKIIEISKWYNLSGPNNLFTLNCGQDLFLKDWLNLYFPAKDYVKEQYVNIYVNLYQDYQFTYKFSASFNEDCTPNAGGNATAYCTKGCPDRRYGGCNHDEGGRHWCDNAYMYCNRTNSSNSTTAICKSNTGSKLLSVSLTSSDLYDRFFARVKQYRYITDGNNWKTQLFNNSTLNWETAV
jgi:hypothetical protein